MPLLLDLRGIAYTGSGPFALSLALRKDKAKDILRARGVPTPPGRAGHGGSKRERHRCPSR